jgi:replicative DNA helicase
VAEKLDHLQGIPLHIFRGSGKTALAIHCHAERLKAKGRLDFAVIDYSGLIRGFGDRQMNRNQEVGEICRQLKEMAGGLEVPLLVLSQLSRAPETRLDKRPVIARRTGVDSVLAQDGDERNGLPVAGGDFVGVRHTASPI